MIGRTVLITGASGFIGGGIARAFVAAGWTVHTASRHGGGPGHVNHACDLLAPSAMRDLMRDCRAGTLVHAAWDVTHGVYWSSRSNLDWLAASVGLVRTFLDAGGARIVGIGTCAEYDWSGGVCREYVTPTTPHTAYGRSKLALFHALESARLTGGSCAWARLFFPYGPGDGAQRYLPSLFRSLLEGVPFQATSGTQVRDFVHINDIGEAIERIAASSIQGAVNVGSGRGVSLRELGLLAADAVGAPRDLIAFGALPQRPDDPPELIADVTRLTGEVGYTPRMGIAAGVRHAAAAFRGALVASAGHTQ